MNTSRDKIKSALQRFSDGNLAKNARHLLNVLGYHSQRIMDLEPNTADEFLSAFNLDNKINEKLASLQEWESVDLLFQLMGEQISGNGQVEIDFGGDDIDKERDKSYLFFALKLCQNHYTRTQLSQITRERKVFFENILIPPIREENQHLAAQIEDRVDKIIAAKRTNPDSDTTGLENEIDQIVYSLYDLTPDEIAIVEEKTV